MWQGLPDQWERPTHSGILTHSEYQLIFVNSIYRRQLSLHNLRKCMSVLLLIMRVRWNPRYLATSLAARITSRLYGPLARYVKLRIAHAPEMPGTFSLSPTSNEKTSKRSRHASRHVRDARAVMHVGIANPRWRGKRSQNSRCMRNPQFYVSGKRSMYVMILSHLEKCG